MGVPLALDWVRATLSRVSATPVAAFSSAGAGSVLRLTFREEA